MKENGNYVCDYCGHEQGNFYAKTGNHVICEDNAKLKKQLAEARALLAIFAEQSELLAHTACGDECEYQQAAQWLKDNPET